LEPGLPQLAAKANTAKAETFREVFFILLSIVFAMNAPDIFAFFNVLHKTDAQYSKFF
jgi:hypothetical protein